MQMIPFFRPGKSQTITAVTVAGLYVGVGVAACFIASETKAGELHPAPLGAPSAFTGLATGSIGSAPITTAPGSSITTISGGSFSPIVEMPNAMGDALVEQFRGAPPWWGQVCDRGSLSSTSVTTAEWRVPPGPWQPPHRA